jgi:TonB family protein
MRKRVRARVWLVFIGIAVLLHVVVLFIVKPSVFSILRGRDPRLGESPAPPGADPDAVLYLRVDVEDVEKPRIPIVSSEPEPADVNASPDEAPSPAQRRGSEELTDLEGMVGDASTAMPRGEGVEPAKIPPRPLQITWPDTRRLKHCLGHRIDVRIQVDDDGRILAVEAQESSDHPEDCVNAALESAKKIVFSPGRINGRPVRMWTEIRIEFRRPD